ncbi:sorbitol dehydrogenase [Patella vulgata]|uniref:sorbitol dehydrogenase n=1 Tax=Patella vulgata TaxID=6465 RepID=UPI0021806BFF|nr:sorbitol dehydrogenase [Patella vulgata]
MSDTNLTAIVYKKGDLRLEETEIKEPGIGQVQLRMCNVGICGSDVHFWTQGAIGDFVVKAPMIIGHEGAGVVNKLGPGVTNLNIGDRVAIEPGVPCKCCKFCKKGRYNLCPRVIFCATPPDHGNLSRFYCHDADFCYKLPDHVSTEEGALLEPLSVSVHACTRAGVTLGSRVLVCGAGPIGLVVLLTAKAKGAAEVIMTDIDKSRLEFAKSLGADHTVLVTSRDPVDTANKVEAILGDKADIAIECSGAPPSIRTAIFATAPGGCVMIVGLGPADVELPIVNATVREVDIRGNFRYANCYPAALDMIASGKVNVKPLITHRFKLEQSLEAFEMAKQGKGIKIMINCEK